LTDNYVAYKEKRSKTRPAIYSSDTVISCVHGVIHNGRPIFPS
jgi:hypothetical protein